MRELIILRHANAVQDTPGGNDFDRGLSARGRRQLKELRRMFGPCSAAPEVLLISAAARTRETAAGLLEAFPEWDCRLFFDSGLYLAGAEELRARIAKLPDEVKRVCLVGHNPGLPVLAEALVGFDVPMPTLGTAAIVSTAPRWVDLADSAASLLWHAVPGV